MGIHGANPNRTHEKMDFLADWDRRWKTLAGEQNDGRGKGSLGWSEFSLH